MGHKVIEEIKKKGSNSNYIIQKYSLSDAGFYGTVAGMRKDKKTINALKEEKLFKALSDEFPELYPDSKKGKK